jgi:hypothetical protein
VNKPTLKQAVSFSIKAVLTLVILYFVGAQLAQNWQSVVQYDWKLDFLLLFVSLILHLVTFILLSWVWCQLMQGFGYQVPLKHGFKVAYIANLGRYIPGRIWPVFGMMYVAKQIKVPKETAVASWGIALLFGTPASFVVALAGMWLYPEILSGSWGIYLKGQLPIFTAATALISICLLFLPKIVVSWMNLLLKRLKRPVMQFEMSVRLASVVYFGYMACWIVYGFAFWVFLRSLSPDHRITPAAAICAFVTAYQAGYFMIFTPGGIGARELVMSAILAPFIGPAAVGIAIAARVWNTLSDVVASIIAIKIKL